MAVVPGVAASLLSLLAPAGAQGEPGQVADPLAVARRFHQAIASEDEQGWRAVSFPSEIASVEAREASPVGAWDLLKKNPGLELAVPDQTVAYVGRLARVVTSASQPIEVASLLREGETDELTIRFSCATYLAPSGDGWRVAAHLSQLSCNAALFLAESEAKSNHRERELEEMESDVSAHERRGDRYAEQERALLEAIKAATSVGDTLPRLYSTGYKGLLARYWPGVEYGGGVDPATEWLNGSWCFASERLNPDRQYYNLKLDVGEENQLEWKTFETGEGLVRVLGDDRFEVASWKAPAPESPRTITLWRIQRVSESRFRVLNVGRYQTTVEERLLEELVAIQAAKQTDESGPEELIKCDGLPGPPP